ncbi:hypothetical protein LJ737_04305 [Hymenobacter sp. 15J16-1T3B]|uniref:hypothetical protein n=1 Tax=Hymenobacter sp. 15J16-1T3B TaxID=2886941 RepID=UPI001D125126|nr:hypothetical protein [Hymenobacter sp. 15J16-1T3B]MCC3156445.1 hypothetical protein [Hymenobacter sp. 15J16-1T3B]
MATCTRPAALSNVSKQDCPIDFKQIQRIILQRLGFKFATEAEMKTLAAWTPLLAAADSTKVVLSPFTTGFVIPPSEPTFINENDNNSLNGMGKFTGLNSVKPTGRFVGLESAIWEQMQQFSTESDAALGVERLGAYLLNQDGAILHNDLGPIPLANFYVADPGSEGFRAETIIPFGFSLKGGWYKGVQLLQPSFNPLVDLD